MNMVFSILILLGFIVSIIFLVRKVAKRWTIWTPKRTVVIISLYILVGLVAMIAMNQHQEDIPILSDEALIQLKEEERAVNEAVYNAAYSLIDKKYIKEQWEYELQGDTLQIDRQSLTDGDLRVYIEQRREVDDQMVYVTYYETPYIQNGIDFSSVVKTPVVAFEQDTFKVTKQEPVELSFRQLHISIAILENPYKPYMFDDLRYEHYGQQILYLNIPKDVHIMEYGSSETP